MVNFEELGVIQVFGVGTVAAHNHLHGLFEVLHFIAQAVQVEVVGDVLLVNLGEELVAFQVAEPLDPPVAALAVVVVVH